MVLFETPYRHLIIVVATALILSFLAFLGFHAKPGRHGWRRIDPSPMHWFALILGGGLVLLFVYIRLFVGSARDDAESQMGILTWLIFAFAVGVTIVAYAMVQTRRVAFEWRSNSLAYSSGSGGRVTRTMDELVEVNRTLLGWVVLSFAGGEIVKLSESARGIEELTQSIVDWRPELFPDVP